MSHLVADENEAVGVRVVAHALKQPINYVIRNKVGQDNYQFILEKIERDGSIFTGFDAKKGNH